MARRLIGTGTTNSQGVAIMNKDPSGNTITGYTGEGRGKLQIIAVSGDIQSEPYTLYDVIFKDIGTDTQYTAWTYLNNVTVTRDSTETKVVQTNTANIGSQYQAITTTDFTIECDIRVEDYYRNMNLFNVRNGTNVIQNIGMSNFALDDGDSHHITLQCINNKLSVQDNGVEVNSFELTSTVNRIYLQTSNGMTVYYKNFVIY